MPLTLESCQANWTEDAKSWFISDNMGNHLLSLPASMANEEVAAVMKFGKRFEKMGFDYGRQVGGDAMLGANNQRMVEMTNKIMVLEHMNDDLANKLAVLIGMKEDGE